MPRTLDRDHARRFLVLRHGLAPPRSLAADPRSVLDVVARLGSLQFDPLATPGARNHDLVLHARIEGFERAWCDRWLYGPPHERRLFEAYNKSLNILAVEDLAAHRFAWERAAARHREGISKTHAAVLGAVLERLRVDGATATGDISKSHGAKRDWYWAPTTEGRAALEALFEMGAVGIARREGSRRWFDLMERLLPGEALARRVTREEAIRRRVLSRHRGVGLLGAVAAAEVYTGTGAPEERAAALRSLVDDGTLTELKVEGVKGPRYALTSELGLLARAGEEPSARAVTFVAPLDPLVWDRRLLRDLFAFEYLWEVYTPVEKRRHGYYVLPLLFGERFVGRVEPRFERDTATLRVLGLWFEEGFDPTREEGFAEAFREALAALARFVGATKVVMPRTKAARALRMR